MIRTIVGLSKSSRSKGFRIAISLTQRALIITNVNQSTINNRNFNRLNHTKIIKLNDKQNQGNVCIESTSKKYLGFNRFTNKFNSKIMTHL